MADTASPQPAPCPPTFESALGELETIVHQLEDGDVGLEEALARYEHGVKLLKHCYGVLQRAERRIEALCGVDADGNPVTVAFDDEASFNETSAAETGRKKRVAADKSRAKSPPTPAEGDSPSVDETPRLF